MAVLMKFKGIKTVYAQTDKIKTALTKAKVDEKSTTDFLKLLSSKRRMAEDKFLAAVNDDPKLKKFEQKHSHTDPKYGKEMKAAADRVDVQLVVASGKAGLKVGKQVVIGG